jgi:subtilisin-like proprotein convertase family protein
LVIFFLCQAVLQSQEIESIWIKSDLASKKYAEKFSRKSLPNSYELYTLKLNQLKTKLSAAPDRSKLGFENGVTVSFPNAKGKQELFEVFEASVMEPKLQQAFPNIRSYVGRSKKNPNSLIRFSVTQTGLHAMTMEESGQTVFIDPYTKDGTSYISYLKKDLPAIDPFVCLVDEIAQTASSSKTELGARTTNANDGKLRIFRLAVATTGEYAGFHLTRQGVDPDASDEVKKAAVLSAINTTMTRVNGLFEKDVALTMVLIENNTDIIFLDAETDGFSNFDSKKLIDESQTRIDEVIGTENYDIGHTFSTGGGGLAQLRSPCTSGGKARGITGRSSPIGDSYDIDYVAHEMGHQYGAHHTFNASTGSCEGNRNEVTSVEPGSGSTIMGYAGLCGIANVEESGQGYFHLVSIREMWSNITTGTSTCAEITDTGNTAPEIEEIPNYNIPHSTPFLLNATATDIDGDNLTYTWEQLDAEITDVPLVSTATGGPAFRSLMPTSDSMRYFPNLSTVLTGNLANDWEVLPSVGRTMLFGVNVRDNNLAGGQTASEETLLTVDGNSGPFMLTSQDTDVAWDAGSVQTIEWDVAGTDVAPVNCSSVNILLSVDGGYTYDTILASNVPNDGSEDVVIPNITTTTGRIKVEAIDNVFYTLNSGVVSVQASEFIMNLNTYTQEVCAPDVVTFEMTYNTFLGFNETTAFSATGNPAGSTVSFNPTSATDNGTVVTMTINGLTTDQLGNHTITIQGAASSTTKNTSVNIILYSNDIPTPQLTDPANGEPDLFQPYTLSWEEKSNVRESIIEISNSSGFSTVVESNTITGFRYDPQNLLGDQTYYWRVKHSNECGEGSYSAVRSFTTNNITCDEVSATGMPLDIPDNDTTGVTSTINISDNKTIEDINITVSITHPYLEDLRLVLESPSGKSVLLANAVGGAGDNFTNTVFDAEATIQIALGFPPFSDRYVPAGDLASLYGDNAQGAWKLIVTDSELQDFGQLVAWSIEICGIQIISDDDDNDGVVNSLDLCPGTILGATVDANGCADNQLDDDQDGVNNDIDLCPDTPLGESVDSNGCANVQLDDDNDGVLNGDDLCPDTPSGRVVDEFGCTVFTIPSDNFSIETISETCPDRNNGSLIISATASYNYSASFDGNVYTFTNNQLTLENLSPGTYDLCITVEGEDYEQCFTVTIDEGIMLSGKSSISGKKATVEIAQGTAPFDVYVNGKQAFRTQFSTFDLDVAHGDLIEVYSAVDCEGVYAKTVELFEAIVAYPNPTQDLFTIALPLGSAFDKVVVELYSIQAQLISKKTYSNHSGRIQLDLSQQPPGMYIAKVQLNKPVHLKIVKQ